MSNTVSCPVSGKRINENAARIAAGVTVILTIVAVIFQLYWIMLILAADFAVRAFSSGKWSPMRWLAQNIVKALNLPNVPVDAAPKKFAAGLGMVFSALIFITGFMQFTLAHYIIAAMLAGCAILESVFAYCLGCVVYTFLMRFLPDKDSSVQFPQSKTG